jgi:hypothetical protein
MQSACCRRRNWRAYPSEHAHPERSHEGNLSFRRLSSTCRRGSPVDWGYRLVRLVGAGFLAGGRTGSGDARSGTTTAPRPRSYSRGHGLDRASTPSTFMEATRLIPREVGPAGYARRSKRIAAHALSGLNTDSWPGLAAMPEAPGSLLVRSHSDPGGPPGKSSARDPGLLPDAELLTGPAARPSRGIPGRGTTSRASPRSVAGERLRRPARRG